MNIGALYSSTGNQQLYRQGPVSAATPPAPESVLEVRPPAGTSSSGATGDTTIYGDPRTAGASVTARW